jgi:acyl-coenzyme A synthetase/AMP-(fatty) acid ligase
MNANRIFEWARVQPDKAALIHNDFATSYLVFARAIDAARRFFAAQELEAGRTAVVVIGHLAHEWIVLLALRSLGLDTLCVPSVEVADGLNLGNVGCVVTTDVERETHVFAGKTVSDSRLIVLPLSVYADVRAGGVPASIEMSRPGGHILYTSGTTGNFKKLLIDAPRQELRVRHHVERTGIERTTVQNCTDLGPWTVAGGSTPLMLWFAGGTVVFDQRPDKLRRFFGHGVTRAWMTPHMLKEVLTLRGDAAGPIEGFELSLGSGFLPLDLAERAMKHLTGKIRLGYSASECTGIARSEFHAEEDIYWLTPQSDRVVEIVDDDERRCGVGEEGRLRVRLAERDSTEYLDDPEATARFFRNGYFYPGDIAVCREDGRIRILGRVDDVLNVQGNKLAIGPLEDKVQRMLGITSVCLFAGLAGDGKEEVVVAIEGDRLPPKEKLDLLARGFPHFGRVRVELVSEFPRTAMGTQKVRRAELRKLVFR